MKTRTTAMTASLLLAGLFLVVGGDMLPTRHAEADDEAPSGGVWTYEVRVVRVDPATKEGAEAADPFGDRMTTKLSWREALSLLKQRGATTILMDQNISTRTNQKASTQSDRTVPIMMLNFASKSDEQKRASNVKTGCRLQLTPDTGGVRYSLRVQWALSAPKSADAPEQFVAEWNGSHAPLRGETLVLHYREQVARDGGSRAVEIYGLVTGRLLP